MSYIKENLMPNEKILYSAQVNPAIFTPAVITFLASIAYIFDALIRTNKNETHSISPIFSYFMAGLFFLFTIRLGVEALTTMLTTEFAITNQRIVAKTGFIHRRTLEMLLPKIESVGVYQNILGRAMNFGNVTITGTGGTKETFRAIIDPTNVRKKVNQIIEHYAQVNNKPTNK